jgi:hypothetical protein
MEPEQLQLLRVRRERDLHAEMVLEQCAAIYKPMD